MACVVLMTVMTIVLVGFVTVRTTRSRLVDRTDASLQNQIVTAKAAIELLTPEVLGELSHIDSLSARESGVVVLDAKGRTLSSLPAESDGRDAFAPSLPTFSEVRRRLGRPFNVTAQNGDRFRVIAGDLGNHQTVVFATPLKAVDQTIHDLTGITIAIGGIATAVLLLLLWFLLAAATKPIDSMIDVAAKIGDGDLAARIDPDHLRGDANRLGTALNQMVSRLEGAAVASAASDQRLRQFVADASHELRTPLTSIRGYAQLCRIGAAGDDAQLAVARIEDEAIRMSALVDDLLLLARLDQGRQSPRDQIEVGAIVREVTDDAHVVDPNRRIEFSAPTECVEVLGNADELRQIVSNLLANVRAHTDPRTPASVTVDATAATVSITVRDEGPGMSEADAAGAFDRFFRSDASRSRRSGGTGLGLSIAKTLVEAHGGTIELATRLDAGTSVRISLPRVRSPSDSVLCQPTSSPTRG